MEFGSKSWQRRAATFRNVGRIQPSVADYHLQITNCELGSTLTKPQILESKPLMFSSKPEGKVKY